MKKYPLEIKNVGDDIYILMSRGHHDIHEFMKKVREDYDWPLGMPQHLWVRAVPTRNPGKTCIYTFTEPNARGAFPITHTEEAWGANSYEALSAPNKEP